MSEHTICEQMHEMCVASLDPQTFEMWEKVCRALYNTRENMKSETPPIDKPA